MAEEKILDIRASMTTAYADCALSAAVHQWPNEFTSRGYSLNDTLRSAGSAVGTGVHAGARQMMTQKMETGMIGSIDDGVDFAVATFEKEIKGGMQPDELTRTPAHGKDQVSVICRTYGGLVGYKTDPIMVEKRFRMSLSHIHPGYTASGQIDLLTKERHLPDLKTGRSEVMYIYQIGMYYWLMLSNKEAVEKGGILKIKRTAVGQPPSRPVPHWYDVKIAMKAAEAITRQIIRDMELFKQTGHAGVFRANPSSLFCSAKYCRAFGTNTCPISKVKESLK